MGKIKPAILCPNCGKLISANTKECIHCGMKNPGGFGIHSYLQRIFRGQLDFIKIVIFICVGLFVFSLLLDPASISLYPGFFSFLSPGDGSLWRLGMTGAHAMAHKHWWTLITAIYLHGGLMHIVFNMLWIRQIGPMVEELFGTARFIIIFTAAGVLGYIISNQLSGNWTIGASGSVFGLFGALIYYGRSRGGRFGDMIYRQLLIWAVIGFIFGFVYPGINNFAHLGGFIGGYLAANLLGYQEKKSENYWHRLAAGVIMLLTILAFVLVILFPTPLPNQFF